VEAHGGRIWAENNNNSDDDVVDGKRVRGATFHFSLPIADIPANREKQKQNKLLTSNREG
jgi:signal transduction histidine kinase